MSYNIFVKHKGISQNILYNTIRLFASISKKNTSFTISYLINSCGLSRESAIKASKYVKFQNPTKPDRVIHFFNKHGFSQTQIMKLVRSQPILLLADPINTILPKVEFFKSKGASQSDIADLFSKYPAIIKSCLDTRIVPAFSLLKSLLGCDEVVLIAAKRYMAIFTRNLEGTLLPNIKVLIDCGVAESSIHSWFTCQPRALMYDSHVVERAVREAKAKGFDPSKRTFLIAVLVITHLGEVGWRRTLGAYQKWGLSEEMVSHAFRGYPWFMMTSEDKITAIMDFMVNDLGWDALAVTKLPQMMNLSLEKRIVPRGRVIKVLMSKGLVKKKYTMRAFFGSLDKVFVERYIKLFEKEVPELIEIYKVNGGLSNSSATMRK